MQGLGAGEVHEGLVDGERLHQGRERQHHGPHLAAGGYFFMSGLMIVASGQSRRALNIGIAECTPKVRAT